MGEGLDLTRLDSALHTEFLGRSVVCHESIGSTMEAAQEEARAGAAEGTAVIAEEQTAGRGRLGRSWVSPPGVNLYVTVIFRPALAQLRHLAIATPLAICQAIEQTTGLFARIKWPNDVLLNGRKVAGVLPQSELAGDEVLFALIGFGVNVNLDAAGHPEIRDIATSLKTELGREVGREETLAAVLDHLETLYEALRQGDIISMPWKQRLATLGQRVRIEAAGGIEEGVAVDADSDGSLILRRDDGSHVRIEAGEVWLQ